MQSPMWSSVFTVSSFREPCSLSFSTAIQRSILQKRTTVATSTSETATTLSKLLARRDKTLQTFFDFFRHFLNETEVGSEVERYLDLVQLFD